MALDSDDAERRLGKIEGDVTELRKFRHSAAGWAQEVQGLRGDVQRIESHVGRIFERIDDLTTTVHNHVQDDATRFGTNNAAIVALTESVKSQREVAEARSDGHERESRDRVERVAERVEQMDSERKAVKGFLLKVLASVIAALILAAGGAVVAGIQMNAKFDETIKVLREGKVGP